MTFHIFTFAITIPVHFADERGKANTTPSKEGSGPSTLIPHITPPRVIASNVSQASHTSKTHAQTMPPNVAIKATSGNY